MMPYTILVFSEGTRAHRHPTADRARHRIEPALPVVGQRQFELFEPTPLLRFPAEPHETPFRDPEFQLLDLTRS